MEVNPDLPPVKDGQVDAMNLMEVEPSPVEETPIEYKSQSYFPDQEKGRDGTRSMGSTEGSRSSSTLGLRLGDHGPAWWLLRIQKYSSYTFTIFATLHITNVGLIPLATQSIPESNRALLLTRPYYQSALTEPLLIGLPLVAHIASGISLRLYRRRQALVRYGAETRRDKRTIPWPYLSGISALGYALTPLAGFHIWTTRILPLYAHGDSALINLSYIGHGFALHRFVSFAGYAALVGTGVWHFVWGAAKWLGWTPDQVPSAESQRSLIRKRKWYTINGVSAAVALVWLAGGLGVVGRGGSVDGWIGREYDDLYRYIPWIGKK